jgi:thiol-disulfide isomerase/thioredoxin
MPLQFNPVKLFAGSGTTVLAQKIAESYGKPLGDVSLSRFSDGEFQPHFNESVRGCDIFLIQSTTPPTENLMELLLINKRILLIAAIILGVFSFHLLFQIIIKGNGSDCGCFGTWLSMTPLQAIIKNAIMLLVIYGLYRLNFSFNLKIKHKEFYISILAITSIFIVNPVDFGYSESYLNKPFSNFRLELDTVYNSKNLEKVEPPKMDLRKGKHIVGFLSSTCGHCKIAAQKLSVIHSENPSIPIYFFINGDNDKIKSFIAKTNTDKIPYSKLNSQLFIELAGLKLPVIYYLNNSVVEKQVDYFTLEQGHIEQWLKK